MNMKMKKFIFIIISLLFVASACNHTKTTTDSTNYNNKSSKASNDEEKSGSSSADLKIYGIDTNGVKTEDFTLSLEEIETEEYLPILTNIYFAPNSDNIASTNIKQLDDLGVSNFREEHLPPDAIELNHTMINLIAYRMYDNSAAKIILTGYADESENSSLALSRANAVKNYLMQNWGISPSKITIKTGTNPKRKGANQSDIIEENSRVEVAPDGSKSNDLFEPIRLLFIEKIANPPMIEFEPVVKDKNINRININVEHNNNEIANFSSSILTNFTWILKNLKNIKNDNPLNIEFTLKDSRNKSQKIKKDINIKQTGIMKKRELPENDFVIERYSLILFDYDKAELAKADKEYLKKIKAKVKPGSEVIISGYADRNGSQEYNTNLAKKRCEEVRKALNVKNTIIKPFGNKVLLFDNTTPEGRALSRTVRVEIKTMLK